MNDIWKLEIKKKVGVVTFNNPPKNFFNMEVMQELGLLLKQIEDDNSIRVVIIKSGIKGVFISGADVNIFKNRPGLVDNFVKGSGAILKTIENFPKPIIAAIEGAAIGGGCEVAVSCDIRVAGESSRFGLSEIIYGLIPAGGVIKRLENILTRGQMMRMLLTGFTYNAIESKDIGLIEEVVPDEKVMKAALKIANRIAALSPLAVSSIKGLINLAIESDFDDHFEKTAAKFEQMLESEDLQEGLAAFFERRLPVYKGR